MTVEGSKLPQPQAASGSASARLASETASDSRIGRTSALVRCETTTKIASQATARPTSALPPRLEAPPPPPPA